MKNDKGFSLIELIIVVAIMAVLVAVIAPNLTRYLGNSKEKADEVNIDTIRKTIEQACAISGTEISNPQSLNTWVELDEGSAYFDSNAGDEDGMTAFAKHIAIELGNVPKSKATGNNFEVKITGDAGSSYTVEVRIK